MKCSRYNLPFEVDGNLYLYNVRTGALARLKDSEVPLNEDSRRLGFAVDENFDEVQKVISDVNTAISKPFEELDVTLLLTECCNFRCVYCYQDRPQKAKFYTDADIKRLFELLRQAIDSGVKRVRVHYFGGEPLMHPSALKSIHEGIATLKKETHCVVQEYITTNASLLDEQILKYMNFDQLQITFDGNRQWHNTLRRSSSYTYDDLLERVDMVWRCSDTKVMVRCNLSKENVDSFEELFEDLMALPHFSRERFDTGFHDLVRYRGTEPFEALTPQEYGEAFIKLRRLLQAKGYRFRLPSALQMPCRFVVGRGLVLGPGLQGMFCTSDASSQDVLHKFHYDSGCSCGPLNLSSVCRECLYLPLCLGGCKLRVPEHGACSPWRYMLIDSLQDYIRRPEEWKGS